jgi:F0F1-type ATP synthase delta subunit
MRTKDYIGAVTELLNEGHDVNHVLPRLADTLARKGHSTLYARILHGVMHELTRREALTQAHVTVGSEKDSTRLAPRIAAALAELNITQEPKTHIDETLIGGFTITHGDRIIDHSYKTQLVALYRALTE